MTVSADGTPESILDDTLISKSGDKPNGKPDDADHAAPSGWAFWSTDRTRTQTATPGGTQKQIGELAVADTPSQSHPEAAQFNEQRDGTKAKPKRNGSLLRRKRANPDKAELSGDSSATTPCQPRDQALPLEVYTRRKTTRPSRFREGRHPSRQDQTSFFRSL